MTKKLVSQANILMLGVLIAFLALISALIWDQFAAARAARRWSDHTYHVLSTIDQLQIAIRDATSGERGYLLTGAGAFLAPYNAALSRIPLLIGELQHLTVDNPEQQTRLSTLTSAWQQRVQQLMQVIQIRQDKGIQAAIDLLNNRGVRRETVATLDSTLEAMTKQEQMLLERRIDAADSRGNWVRGLVLFGTIVAILGLLWAARLLNQAYSRSYKSQAEQRTLAARLHASLDSLSQGVGVFGPGHRLRHWNECFRVLLDLPPAMVRAETPYATFFNHFSGKGCGLLESEEQIEHGQIGTDPIVYERTHPNGRELEIRRTPTPDGGFVVTITDLTKRAQSEAVLREAHKMQAIGQLTGGIAHDFNNLLTVILGNLELARAKMDAQHPLLANVERSLWAAQRGGTLTSQLLAFARKQPLAPAAIDLSATLPELVPLLRRTLGEHIDVRFVDTAGLWPALADPAQLESAVLNLALNARDAMPGGGRLTIELANKVIDADYAAANTEVVPGDYVMVAVSDTGHGMTPEIVARVFEPFFTTKTEGRGTGLGLAMVFGFIKQSGGHVKVYSEPGEGTSVKLYLPRAVGSALPAAQRSSQPAELPHGSATILVVEDEAAVREIAVAILRNLGYHVLEAADGDEGLAVFGAHAAQIDMLLTDVVLPGEVRGRELAERITAMRPEVKVMFMSGYTENSIVHHGRLDDGVQLLGKPFKREQLARRVAALLTASSPTTPSDAVNVVDLRARKRD